PLVPHTNTLLRRVGCPGRSRIRHHHHRHVRSGNETVVDRYSNNGLARGYPNAALREDLLPLDRHPRFASRERRDEPHRERVADIDAIVIEPDGKPHRVIVPRRPTASEDVAAERRRDRASAVVLSREYDAVVPGRARGEFVR